MDERINKAILWVGSYLYPCSVCIKSWLHHSHDYFHDDDDDNVNDDDDDVNDGDDDVNDDDDDVNDDDDDDNDDDQVWIVCRQFFAMQLMTPTPISHSSQMHSTTHRHHHHCPHRLILTPTYEKSGIHLIFRAKGLGGANQPHKIGGN